MDQMTCFLDQYIYGAVRKVLIYLFNIKTRRNNMIELNRYQFDKISSRMAKEYGTIKKGDEEMHLMTLSAMEGNLLKQYRRNYSITGRCVIEAIHICLLKIDGIIANTQYNIKPFLTPEIESLVYALLMSFDPFTNDEVKAIVELHCNLAVSEELKQYYIEPVQCLLKIEKSVDFWSKNMGVNGYFNFLEESFGSAVENNQKMNFSVKKKASPCM